MVNRFDPNQVPATGKLSKKRDILMHYLALVCVVMP